MRSCLLLLACGALFAQPPLKFEVASIKPAQPMPMGRMMVRMNSDAGMLRYINVSLKDCIRVAYGVKDFQIQGPDWLGSTRFDILAKLPEGASKDQIPEMMQSLLADRFKLALHHDTKDHKIYALVVGSGGPKLKSAEVSTRTEAGSKPGTARQVEDRPGGVARPGGPGAMMMMIGPGGLHLKAPSATVSQLAEMLSRFTERPVVDMTGIKGDYDFEMAFTPETMPRLPPGGKMPPPPGAERPRPLAGAEVPAEPAASVFDAVKQYGLKLDPRKAPLEMLTIDHIEKTPTEN